MAPEKEPAKKAAAADEDDDDDSVPIALSRSKLAKSRDALRKRAAEEEDEDDRLLFAHSKVSKKKPGTPNGSGPVKVKKEEAGEEVEDRKKKPPKEGMITKKEDKKIIKKKVVVNKKVDKKVSKVTTVEKGKKKEKKVYDLPGQKHDPPEERDPLRIFYETLYQQLPNSEMAQYWMMEYGLLPLKIAEEVYTKKLKKNPQSRLNSPVKAVSTKKTPVSVKTVKQVSAGKATSKTTAKRKLASTSSDDDDGDDDFVSPKRKPKKQKVSG